MAETIRGDSPSKVIGTERLVIRRAQPGDTDMFFDLWTDPAVMTNVGYPQGLRITRQEIKDRLVEHIKGDEFGVYLVVVLRQSGQRIGECKMYRPDDEGISRTDVKLLPYFWGHKYGVEVKQALVDHLFIHTDCDAVEGTPNVENIASIKMQEAVGAVRVGECVFDFPEHMRDYTSTVHSFVYLVHRSAWEDRRSSNLPPGPGE